MTRQSPGFTLIEILLVSALGSLVLLAATQILASLVQQQAEQAAWLRLEERARLVELVLKYDLANSYHVLAAGTASHRYPDFVQVQIELNQANLYATRFNSFRSSDWLLVNRQPPGETADYSLWHVDQKEYGLGLANKTSSQDKASILTSSQTLIAQVEHLSLRFYSPASERWLQATDLEGSWEEVTSVQFAAILVSDQALRSKPSQTSITLWGEKLSLADDGRLRVLVEGRSNLRRPD